MDRMEPLIIGLPIVLNSNSPTVHNNTVGSPCSCTVEAHLIVVVADPGVAKDHSGAADA
jgi:hypothetical protein